MNFIQFGLLSLRTNTSACVCDLSLSPTPHLSGSRADGKFAKHRLSPATRVHDELRYATLSLIYREKGEKNFKEKILKNERKNEKMCVRKKKTHATRIKNITLELKVQPYSMFVAKLAR